MVSIPITINEKTFSSNKAACLHFNICPSTFKDRISRGHTILQALGLEERPTKTNHWTNYDIKNSKGESAGYGSYNLYEIVNLINGKKYIGLTVQTLTKRYYQHIFDSKTQNYPLYRAMRKYGIENFEIQLIRNDAKNGYELQIQETEEIILQDTRNPQNGYNISTGGSPGNGKSIRIANIEYNTHAEAASYYGIDSGVFAMRLRSKWTPEEAVDIEPPPNLKRHKVELDGKLISMRQAAKLNGINYKTVHFRIQQGWTYQQALDIESPPEGHQGNIKICINGTTYASLYDAAAAYNIRYQTVHQRIKYQKWTLEEALEIKQREKKVRENGTEVQAFGKSYKSISACARDNGLKMPSIVYRIQSYSETTEEAIIALKNAEKKILAFGKHYPSMTACAKAHGIDDMRALWYRVHERGETIEEGIKHLKDLFQPL